MGDALTKVNTKKVVVFDFMGPDERLTQLGRDLADGFSRTLASASGKFAVIDRPQIQAIIEKNRVAPDVIRDSEIAWWLARQLNADALIVGQLTASSGDTLKIAVAAAKTKDGKEIANLAVEVPFTNDMKMKTRLSESLSLQRKGDWVDSKYPKELVPKCIYCPRPEFPSAALAQKKEGTVSLIVQITVDGVAKDIDFVQGQQYGLTQKAIEAVQKWKFQPAQSAEGKPRPVWQQIQVTFHLF
jgi:TonB family protein